jgi:fatty-acyl-CoA synthase
VAPALFKEEPPLPEPEAAVPDQAPAEAVSEPVLAEPPAEAAHDDPGPLPAEESLEPAVMEEASPLTAAAPAPEPERLALGLPGPQFEPQAAEPADASLPEEGIFLRLDHRPHADRRKAKQRTGRLELFLNLVAVLALAPALLVIGGALGVRFGLIDWRVGVGELILDWPSKVGLIAVLAGIFAVFASAPAGFRRYGLQAIFSLALPAATLIAITWLRSVGEGYPPVHDVATDWTHPIPLSAALVRERGADAYPVEDAPIVPASAGTYMMRAVGEVNAETCPGARPVNLSMSPASAYARAKSAVAASGLGVFSDDALAGRLEASATGVWLGLKDDVAIRVEPEGEGSRVDVRSVSRGGLWDFGENCRRVTALVRRIEVQTGA